MIPSSIKRIRSGDKHTVQLQTLRKPTSLQLGAPEEEERIYTTSEAIRLKVDADLSDRNLFKVLKSIRYIFGRKSLQSGIKAALFQHKNMFSDLFAVKKIPMESPGGVRMPHVVVYCIDVISFINRVAALRKRRPEDFIIKCGIDYGQSFLKVTVTLAESSTTPGVHRNASNNGGKKTMLLAVCQAPETYANLRSLFTLLKASRDFECVYAADLKVVNIVTGLSSHSSRHPCPYCTSKSGLWDTKAPLRTIQMNSDNYELWESTSGNKLFNKIFFNCLNPPLLQSSQPILLICPPPPLHIKLDVVNLLIQRLFALHPNLEKDVTAALGIDRKDYHGKSFEGRQCSKILANCDYLEDHIPPECLPLINCLRSFGKVMVATFGEDLSSNNDDVIKRFGSAFSKVMTSFGIRMTPKVHIVLHHLPYFIRLTNMPLGLFSEQVVEEQHARFRRFYDRYRVSCTDHITYSDRLFK